MSEAKKASMKTKTKWVLISGAVALGGASLWALTHPLQAIFGVAVLGGGAFVASKLRGGKGDGAGADEVGADQGPDRVREGVLEEPVTAPSRPAAAASAARSDAELSAELEALRARMARGER